MQQLSLFSLGMPIENLAEVKVPKKAKKHGVKRYIKNLFIDIVDCAKQAVTKPKARQKRQFIPGKIETVDGKITYHQPITGCSIVFYKESKCLAYFTLNESPYSIKNADEEDFDHWVKVEEKEAKHKCASF